MYKLILLFPFLCGFAYADSVQVKLEFMKKPPKVGMAYIVEDKPVGKTDDLDQKNKKFTKKLIVSDSAGQVVFKNTDEVDHNIFANDLKSGAQFDVGLMSPGNSVKKEITWKEDTMVRLGCKIHPKMRTYLANINSDSFVKMVFTKDKLTYDFLIDDIKSDSNKVGILFPGYDYAEVEVDVGSKKTIAISKRGVVRANATFIRK